MSDYIEKGKKRLREGLATASRNPSQQTDDTVQARLLVSQPTPSLSCGACVASFAGDPELAPGGKYCMAINPLLIEIRSIESKDDGWTAKGVGSIESVKCTLCGMMYDAILHAIPIQCSSFTCQICGTNESLIYKVNRIDTAFHQFEFEVEINCNRCNKKRGLKSLIKSILDVVKIKVTPTSVTVEIQ